MFQPALLQGLLLKFLQRSLPGFCKGFLLELLQRFLLVFLQGILRESFRSFKPRFLLWSLQRFFSFFDIPQGISPMISPGTFSIILPGSPAEFTVRSFSRDLFEDPMRDSERYFFCIFQGFLPGFLQENFLQRELQLMRVG